MAASITDAFDGHIARSRNLITDFGKLMDPLADKLLVVSALVCLVQLGDVQGWMVIVILAREFLIAHPTLSLPGSSPTVTPMWIPTDPKATAIDPDKPEPSPPKHYDTFEGTLPYPPQKDCRPCRVYCSGYPG